MYSEGRENNSPSMLFCGVKEHYCNICHGNSKDYEETAYPLGIATTETSNEEEA